MINVTHYKDRALTAKTACKVLITPDYKVETYDTLMKALVDSYSILNSLCLSCADTFLKTALDYGHITEGSHAYALHLLLTRAVKERLTIDEATNLFLIEQNKVREVKNYYSDLEAELERTQVQQMNNELLVREGYSDAMKRVDFYRGRVHQIKRTLKSLNEILKEEL